MASVERVTGEVAWWWSGGSQFARLHPKILSLVGIAIIALGLTQYWAALLLTIAPFIAWMLWARAWPHSYNRVLGDRLWRRRVRRSLVEVWPELMAGCGLTHHVPATTTARGLVSARTPSGSSVRHPRLTKVRWHRGDLVAAPVLLAGQTVADIDAATEALRTTMGADRIRVIPNRAATGCEVAWSFGDPLRDPFSTPAPEVGVGLDPSLLGAAPVGRDTDGAEFTLPVRVHTFVAGATGSGKSSWMWGPLFALAPAIRSGLVQVHGIDQKGGMELRMGERLLSRCATTAVEAVVLLEDAAEAMKARAERLAGRVREHTPTAAEPLIVVLVDELSALTAYQTDRELLKRAEAALGLLLSQGRAPGVVVWAFTQDPRKEVAKLRNLFTQMIGLRLQTADETRMVLGDGVVAAGALCHQIPVDMPGTAYVITETGRPQRVRAGHVSDAAIRDTARHFATPVRMPIVIPEPEEKPTARARKPRSGKQPTTGTPS